MSIFVILSLHLSFVKSIRLFTVACDNSQSIIPPFPYKCNHFVPSPGIRKRRRQDPAALLLPDFLRKQHPFRRIPLVSPLSFPILYHQAELTPDCDKSACCRSGSPPDRQIPYVTDQESAAAGCPRVHPADHWRQGLRKRWSRSAWQCSTDPYPPPGTALRRDAPPPTPEVPPG